MNYLWTLFDGNSLQQGLDSTWGKARARMSIFWFYSTAVVNKRSPDDKRALGCGRRGTAEEQ